MGNFIYRTKAISWNFKWVTVWQSLSRVFRTYLWSGRVVCSSAEVEGCARAHWNGGGRCTTLTFNYSSNLDANRRTPGSIRRRSSIQTGWRARFRCNSGRSTGDCVCGLSGAGVGPDGRRIGAPPPALWSRGCGAAAELWTCHGAASALFAPWSPTRSAVAVLLSARRLGRRALHRPAALRLPPCRCAPHIQPPPRVALHPHRPEEFSASGGKNRLCSGPRIISARRTAPLRPRRAEAETVKRSAPRLSPADAFHLMNNWLTIMLVIRIVGRTCIFLKLSASRQADLVRKIYASAMQTQL